MILRRMRAGKLGPVMTVMIAMGMLSACSTLSTDTALLLARGGIATPAWQKTGIPPSEVASWIHYGFTASQAAKWRTVFPASTASRAAKWRDAGFFPSQAYRWDGVFTDGQVSPHQAALWRRGGFNATQAGSWNHFGFSPRTAQIWEKAGVDNAKEAAAWKSGVIGQNGITQPQVLKTAAAWRTLWGGSYSSGMCNAATTLMQHGQSPNTVKPYITHGLSMAHPHEILNAQSLVHHGLNLSKAVFYGKHGVKYDHIAQYNHERKIRGNASVQYKLGRDYYFGKGRPRSDRKSVYWWRKAARQGLAKAQAALGRDYYFGDGVPTNYPKARAWFHKAAVQGNAEAELYMGFDFGKVVPTNEKSAYWWRKAARQGNVKAEYDIANAYYTGRGVPQNDQKGAYWDRKAARQGNVTAEVGMGEAYASGNGVPANYVQAYKWLALANAQGGIIVHSLVSPTLNSLTQRMSPAQITQGQTLAYEWEKAHGH